MITREELGCYLDDYLACDTFNDYAPNGLQVEGRTGIKKICTAVTASEAVIKEAAAKQADALLVHHGYFWRGEDAIITGMRRQRIGQLIINNINLFAYHLPLDCHSIVGNNACISKRLSLDTINSHKVGKTRDLLWSGVLKQQRTSKEFIHDLSLLFQRDPLYIGFTEKLIHKIAWCSGAAQDYIEEAARLGVDAYFSGEISERTYYQAQELGIHYFACGHHATERYGIQALGEHLSEHFKLHHQFIESDNPV